MREGGDAGGEIPSMVGDPPDEQQGRYSIFDSDTSTLAVMRRCVRMMGQAAAHEAAEASTFSELFTLSDDETRSRIRRE